MNPRRDGSVPSQGREQPLSTARGPRRSQAQRTAESDRRILRAALRLVAERGYRATSLAAIGEAAGYSRGLVSERFGSKAGLLWVLVRSMLREWSKTESHALADTTAGGPSAAMPEVSAFGKLDQLLENHASALARQPDTPLRAFYILMFEALGPIPQLLPEFQKLHQTFRRQLETILREGMANGEMRADLDPAAQAVLFMAQLRGLGFQWLLEPQAFSLEATYAELRANLVRSLLP